MEEEKQKSKRERRKEKKEKQRKQQLALQRRQRFTKLAVVLSVFLVVFGGGYFWYRSATAPSEFDALAKCLTEKGAKMFGAYWCPSCKEQKKEFGSAWRFIKYVECSLPNAAGQTKHCNEAGIESYPTWEFTDGQRLVGKISPEELAAKSACTPTLPSS